MKMISQKMADAVNAQINKEMYSAYLYMSMSAQCSEMNLGGFAKWFMIQYHEEMFHAMKFYGYLLDQNARPRLAAIQEPPVKFAGVKDMFEKTYEHEKGVTQSIRNLMEISVAEKDYATQNQLKWYIDEQVEEEKNDVDMLAKIEMAGSNPAMLMMLDGLVGNRTLGVESDFSKR
jgi:ferritin